MNEHNVRTLRISLTMISFVLWLQTGQKARNILLIFFFVDKLQCYFKSYMLFGSFFPGTGLLILLIIMCAACLLPYRHDGMGRKKFLWCLKLKVITNEVAAALHCKPVMDFSPWASTFKAKDKNLVRPRVIYSYCCSTTNQEIAFLHDQQI